jgi:methyl-accepting chemotaxis protein
MDLRGVATPARPLAAPDKSPGSSATRASARHSESTHRTPLLLPRRSIRRALADQAHTTPGSAQAVALTREASRRFGAFEATNARPSDRLNEEEQRLEGNADAMIRAGVAGLGAALVVALAVAVYTSVHATRALTGPLRRTAWTLGRLTAGDRAARVEVTGPEEIRALGAGRSTCSRTRATGCGRSRRNGIDCRTMAAGRR